MDRGNEQNAPPHSALESVPRDRDLVRRSKPLARPHVHKSSSNSPLGLAEFDTSCYCTVLYGYCVCTVHSGAKARMSNVR